MSMTKSENMKIIRREFPYLVPDKAFFDSEGCFVNCKYTGFIVCIVDDSCYNWHYEYKDINGKIYYS